MTDLTYHVVDVFTDRPFAGNPLAVVLDADTLSTAQLQALAREFNLSETAFPVADAETDYRLRIFTPYDELPFAGHPSVGTAVLLARLGRVAPGRVVMRCGAGLLPLTVSADRAEVTAGTPSVGEPLDAEPFAAACGLTAADTADATVRVCSAGLPFVFLELAADEAVARAAPEPAALRRVCEPAGATDVVVFAWDPATLTSHARMFDPFVGEDPATGSAAAAFGAWLVAAGRVPAGGETAYAVRQGEEIGRPSRIEARSSRTTASRSPAASPAARSRWRRERSASPAERSRRARAPFGLRFASAPRTARNPVAFGAGEAGGAARANGT